MTGKGYRFMQHSACADEYFARKVCCTLDIGSESSHFRISDRIYPFSDNSKSDSADGVKTRYLSYPKIPKRENCHLLNHPEIRTTENHLHMNHPKIRSIQKCNDSDKIIQKELNSPCIEIEKD